MARKTGTSMSYASVSPRKRRSLAAARLAEEQRWKNLAGPVRTWTDLSLLRADSASE